MRQVALKDLIASKATLNEGAIEEIVSKYVHYDVDEKEVLLTAAGQGLGAKKKLLVYLVALQGWPFVTDEAVPTDASPGQIGAHLGLPGGTVRPMLMDLADRHLIAGNNGRYRVRAANLPLIRKELSGEAGERGSRQKPSRRRTNPRENGASAAADSPRGNKPRRKGSLSARIDGWIETGFFDRGRTLADVGKKFRQEGIIIPLTSLPYYLLTAVRKERLTREEAEVVGKNVWVYRTYKATER
jgi:hypothetical protein